MSMSTDVLLTYVVFEKEEITTHFHAFLETVAKPAKGMFIYELQTMFT